MMPALQSTTGTAASRTLPADGSAARSTDRKGATDMARIYESIEGGDNGTFVPTAPAGDLSLAALAHHHAGDLPHLVLHPAAAVGALVHHALLRAHEKRRRRRRLPEPLLTPDLRQLVIVLGR